MTTQVPTVPSHLPRAVFLESNTGRVKLEKMLNAFLNMAHSWRPNARTDPSVWHKQHSCNEMAQRAERARQRQAAAGQMTQRQ
jgi:hypothetical protein